MNIQGPGVYFTIPILGGITITQTTVASFFVMLLLCIAGICLGRNLKKRPSGKQVLTEKVVDVAYSFVSDAMGQHNAHWTPYIGTLFLTSLFGSLIGMTGIFRSTTSDLSTTATWAIVTSILVWYNSIRNFGVGTWLKGFTEPIFIMTPMNIISEIAQPISLAFRHFGNVAGGGVLTTMLYWALSGGSVAILRLINMGGYIGGIVTIVLGLFLAIVRPGAKKKLCKLGGIALTAIGASAIIANWGVLGTVPILQVGLPAFLSLYFDVFSGLIQAFIFSLLSMIFISNACPAPENAAK